MPTRNALQTPAKEVGKLKKMTGSVKALSGRTRLSDHPLSLQYTVGNNAVGRMIQAKLKVSQLGDQYEQEADRMADAVLLMPEPNINQRAFVSRRAPGQPIQRICPECQEGIRRQPVPEEDEQLQRQPLEEEEESLQTKAASGKTPDVSPTVQSRIDGLRDGGRPLPRSVRTYFEPRFGQDFGGVRVHTGAQASEIAQAVNARAFTVGREVVFGAGEYAPGTSEGKRLLAHELTHVMQQSQTSGSVNHAIPQPTIQRTAASCPTGWSTTVRADHNRALSMIDVARRKLSSYNGTTPPEVKTALDAHFKASSTGFAGWVNFNLLFLKSMASMASYDCEDTGSWWCDSSALAKTFWCVPFVDIRVCQPRYFLQSPNERAATLIHEWVHKYGCNFDLGYSHEPDYPSQWTITALLNADPWSELVKDVQ